MGWREWCVICVPIYQEDQTRGEITHISYFKGSISDRIWHTSQSSVPNLDLWLNVIIEDKEAD